MPEREFIGVDGEGVTLRTGEHRYVLLSVGDQSLHKNGERLRFTDIMPFLYEQYLAHPDAIFVGFYLTYDFAQWFRDLPLNRAEMLFTERGRAARKRKNGQPIPFPVYFAGWQFDLLGMRRLRLRPDNDPSAGWLYVCDTGSFWQTSFVSAIDPGKWPEPIVTADDYAVIVEGKQLRSSAGFDPAMIRYNITENRALSAATHRLDKGFRTSGWNLKKQQWMGPGQAADVWLKSINAPTAEQIQESVPAAVLDAARSSYYGGWFEIPRHGLIDGTTYEYDINSAYPFIISQLPCLLHGRWERGNLTPGTQLVRCEVSGSDPFLGPLPHRDRRGIIARPRRTTGWYWTHELEAAHRAGLIDAINVQDLWTYLPCDCPRPFASIADLYRQRLEVGKNTAHGKSLKLVYNSAYGKFAQSIGNPRYANSIYASSITSGCRTMILNAIATHPNRSRDVLMVATDGVYFRSPHPSLNLSADTLGSWDAATKENMTLFMPGVYWDDKAREGMRSSNSLLKSRGINGIELAKWISSIDVQFDIMRDVPGSVPWPVAEIPVRFSVVSPNLALARRKWDRCGCIITDGVRELSSVPENKRDATVDKDTRLPSPGSVWVDDGILTTAPYDDLGQNFGYDKYFGMAMQALNNPTEVAPEALRSLLDAEAFTDNDIAITDDGTVNLEVVEMLGLR